MSGLTVYVGFDPRPPEATAFAVCRFSIRRRSPADVSVFGLRMKQLVELGLYKREHEWRDVPDKPGVRQMWDLVSDAPMSTEFSISRFFVPLLGRGLTLFQDSDMLARADYAGVLDHVGRQPGKAAWVVKHDHRPTETSKSDGRTQTSYPRKNWSSFVVFDCDHPKNRAALTLKFLNETPGLLLHQFCWLDDDDIGELPVEWNWLVRHSPAGVDPKNVHFTDGMPLFERYANDPFADEWRAEFHRWAE